MRRLTITFGQSRTEVFEDFVHDRILDGGLLQIVDADGITHTFAPGYWRRLKYEEVDA